MFLLKLARFNGDFQHPKNDKYVHIHWDEDSHCEAIVGAVLKECMNQAIVVTTKGKVATTHTHKHTHTHACTHTHATMTKGRVAAT